MMITWQDLHHTALTPQTLYALLQLRCAVFIVEQHCPYQDVDGADLQGETRHILGWRDNKLVACARILTEHDGHPLVIGRVVVDSTLRGIQLGQQLMTRALECCEKHWPGAPVWLGAQAHLQHFYGQFGFHAVSDIYLEDGIAHIGMQR